MGDKTKTLVIFSPGFPENEADSTCLPAQQIFVKNLKKKYPKLNIIVLAFEYPFLTAEYQWHGVTVVPFAGYYKRNLFRLGNWISIWRRLKQLNRQYKLIGLLSFWTGECALLGNTFAKRNGLKHFCWILGQDAKPGNKYLKWIKPQGESLIALSDSIANEFYKNYNLRPCHIIPIGIDPALFGSAPAIRDIDILGVGSLIPLKRYYLLVNIVDVLRNSFPGIRVLICGKGPEFEPLDAMIRTLHLESNVKLTGELPHASVLALMQRTKIFVHTSVYEGFSSVCLEALNAGAQVVSFVRPMEVDIKNWHFAHIKDDMQRKISELLETPDLNHDSVSPYLVHISNKAIMKLFDYNEVAN
jgi:glycosyltransferase involved in cell wall biosynthesis